MNSLPYIFTLTVIVFYVDYMRSKSNTNVPWNGFGAIFNVLGGRSEQPMQYRVLVPWIMGLMTVRPRNYWILRVCAIYFALYSAHLYFASALCTALLALFFVWAALYDYTDGYLEVGFFAMCFWLMTTQTLTGVVVVPILVFLAALNRETGVFIPIVLFLAGEWIVASLAVGGFIAGYMLPRLYYGRRGRYCPFFMVGENIRRIRSGFMRMEYLNFAFVFVLLLVAYLGTALARPLTPVEQGMGLMFLALLVPAVWCEIRVFKPVMLAVIPMVSCFGLR